MLASTGQTGLGGLMHVQVMRSFIAVASHHSVTAAAKSLGYSQPAVTQHVQRMERLVGGRLIERSGGIALTNLGRRVLPVARIAVVAVDGLIGSGLAHATPHRHSQ